MRRADKVANDLKISFDALNKTAKKLGIGQPGRNVGKSRMLTYDEIELIEKELDVVVKPKVAVKTPLGAFLGLVFNPETDRFEVCWVILRKENLNMYEHKVIMDTANVYGGIIEINKHFPKEINDKTIETKVEEK